MMDSYVFPPKPPRPADSTATPKPTTTAVPSAPPSGQVNDPPELDDVGMHILLLRLMAILNNKNGDTSLKGFNSKQDAAVSGPSEPSSSPLSEANLIPLEAVCAILVQQHEIIATVYQENTPSNVAFNRDCAIDSETGISTNLL